MSQLEELASARLPTRYGEFRLCVFRYPDENAHPALSAEHLAMVYGDVQNATDPVLVRIHSECLTGDALGSMRCDCRAQLDASQRAIAAQGRGVVVYLRQEGRGIGLVNKIRAYALQEQGADTVEANEQLHLPVDARQYDVAAEILKSLGVGRVRLLTNNPDKVQSLSRLGIVVTEKEPLVVHATEHSADYLSTKRERMNHDIPSDALAAPPPKKSK
jgi:3,4-dihydroxy 2-butanone 4-phosphate synthase/GTP cyclohydrolase II